MGETSVYFVPADDARWIGRERGVVEAFWRLGVFVVTPDRWVYDEIERFKREGRPLPDWEYRFSFAEMGLGGLGAWEPVPNVVYEQTCPHCSSPITDQMHELWCAESDVLLPERSLTCSRCRKRVGAREGVTDEPFVFSRFYLWVAEIDLEDWEPDFKATVESVLGPCSEFQAWET